MVSTSLGCAADFVPSILLGRLTGFRRVTEAHGCKLRKGMFADGLVLGVVDRFRACFFFFFLLYVIHGFASATDSSGFGAWLIEYRYHTELTDAHSTVMDTQQLVWRWKWTNMYYKTMQIVSILAKSL